jgi:carbon monoxide dehydrogenase subunit G
MSTIKPEPMRIDEYSVWVHTDISPVSSDDFNGFEYDMVQYEKDEFILNMYEKMNATIDAVVDIDVALVKSGLMAISDVNEIMRERVEVSTSGKGSSLL